MFKGPKILPSQQLGAAVAPWPGATGLIASVTADDMAHKGKCIFSNYKVVEFQRLLICTIGAQFFKTRLTCAVAKKMRNCRKSIVANIESNIEAITCDS